MYTHGPMEVGVRGSASFGNKMLNEEMFGDRSLLEMYDYLSECFVWNYSFIS